MQNHAQQLATLGLEFQRRSIPHTVGHREHAWTRQAVPTLTAGHYLGQVQVTVTDDGYRWLDRHGHAHHMPTTEPAAVADRIISERAGTVEPPEPDPHSPAPPLLPLPRRRDRPPQPLFRYRPDEPA